ncbi:hypothetical protein R6Q57_011839 [Mikania cordata]
MAQRRLLFPQGRGKALTVSVPHKVADAPSLSICHLDLAYIIPEIELETSESIVTKGKLDAHNIARLKQPVTRLVENHTKITLVTTLLSKYAMAVSTKKWVVSKIRL